MKKKVVRAPFIRITKNPTEREEENAKGEQKSQIRITKTM
jgi:hypothetical protein